MSLTNEIAGSVCRCLSLTVSVESGLRNNANALSSLEREFNCASCVRSSRSMTLSYNTKEALERVVRNISEFRTVQIHNLQNFWYECANRFGVCFPICSNEDAINSFLRICKKATIANTQFGQVNTEMFLRLRNGQMLSNFLLDFFFEAFNAQSHFKELKFGTMASASIKMLIGMNEEKLSKMLYRNYLEKDMAKLFIPQLSDGHFYLYEVNFHENIVISYDSLDCNHNQEGSILAQKLGKASNRHFYYRPEVCTRQSNNTDCGLHTLLNMLCSVQVTSHEYDEDIVGPFRMYLLSMAMSLV